MATAKGKPVLNTLIGRRQPKKTRGRKLLHPIRGHRKLIALSLDEILRREHGWNDRFIYSPPKRNKTHAPASLPMLSTPSKSQTKGSTTRHERAQHSNRGGKRSSKPKKPSSMKLNPLRTLLKPSAEAGEEEKLHFNVLKAIDTRETLLSQLSALILCMPVLEPPRTPSRPIDAPTINNASRQQMRSRGGVALTPTPLNQLSGNAEFLSNVRETTKLTQQLATDLQLTGIHCVEALVAWMLEAGAQSATPPPYLWRGRNYFVKMFNDLDFADAELQARGIKLDCFRPHNPLLIKPIQKLGRVLAAHFIIMEMVKFAKDLTPIELLAFNGRMRDYDCEKTEPTSLDIKPQTSSITGLCGIHNKKNQAVRITTTRHDTNNGQALERNDIGSAIGFVCLLDESRENGHASREADVIQSQRNLLSKSRVEYEYDDNNITKDKSKKEKSRCVSGFRITEHDIITDIVTSEEKSMRTFGSLVNDDNCGWTRNQYNSESDTFDGKGCDGRHRTYEGAALQLMSGLSTGNTDLLDPERPKIRLSPDKIVSKTGIANEAGPPFKQLLIRSSPNHNQSEHGNVLNTNTIGFGVNSGNREVGADVQQLQSVLIEPSENRLTDGRIGLEYASSFDEIADDGSMKSDDDGMQQEMDPEAGQTILDNTSKLLDKELKRWTILVDKNRPTQVNALNAHSCLRWQSTRALRISLSRHFSISECMEGSIISMLDQYGLIAPDIPLVNLLCSDVAQGLNLASHLIQECHVVLGDICAAVTDAIHSSLGLKTSLVSEIEVKEVIEIAEAVRVDYHHSTWKYVKNTTMLLNFLHTSDNATIASLVGQSPISVELSQLVKVFYPYLINDRREKLSNSWDSVSKILAAMGVPTDCLYVMLDSMCKTLLLTVELCGASNKDFQNEGALLVFPKVTVICDRENILQSSAEFISENNNSYFSIFPFFKSSFGEKIVNGIRVEEGEGRGPLKEWFTLVGAQLAAKWKLLPVSKVLTEADSTQVTASENKVTIPGASDVICSGFQLKWKTNEGETICRIVNGCIEGESFLLNQAVPSHSFTASQLHIFQPSAAVFEYVQGSESYWLNVNTRDSPEFRDVLVFTGWFIACAVTHFCSIHLRIHPLFFRLLLNSQHCVSLEEISFFDPQLFKSLSAIKHMTLSDFAELLRLEGAEESLSAEAYISSVLESKFGLASGIGWQLQSVRCGFGRVINIEQLTQLGITDADLVNSICGSCGDPTEDFVIKEIYRIATDSDFSDCRPMVDTFWLTVNSFEPLLKRKFIKFVTGVDSLPLAGIEFLRIEMPFTANSSNDLKKCLGMLPQAHTCDNTLELPHYWKALCWRDRHDENEANINLEEELARILNKKIREAVEYSSGYGLDNALTVEGALSPLNSDGYILVKEDSYDSVGLPALLDEPPENSLPSHQTPSHVQTGGEINESKAMPVDLFMESISPRPEDAYDYDDWEEESTA